MKKKLIEVALPLNAINNASSLEKQPFTRKHPRSLHVWWARRPLTAARAVIFAQMVDDPSANPDLFPTEKAQEKERQRLFKIIEDLVQWENTTNEEVLERARAEIWQSWRRACAENADHPRAKELFDRHVLPAFHDPFAGGGSLPLEAQRLGMESYASDLNPVAVLINKAIIEIPYKFACQPPVNPQAQHDQSLFKHEWKGIQGLAEDLRYYGQWIRDQAEKRIGHLYPQIEVTTEIANDRPDLQSLIGRKLTIIAWLWSRTVKSPNPAFAHVDVPLTSTFMLSTKSGKEAYVEPVIKNDNYSFTVKVGKPKDINVAKQGTKSGGSGSSFFCLMSKTPMPFEYLRSEAKAGRMSVRLMAIVAEGQRGRIYLPPLKEMETVALCAKPHDTPETDLPAKALGFRIQEYGMTKWCDLFTSRQLVALTTFTDLVGEAMNHIRQDAIAIGRIDDCKPLHKDGTGILAYSEAVGTYLAISISRWCDLSNSLCSWNNINQNIRALFARQAIPMNWDYAELSPFSKVGSWFSTVESAIETFESLVTRQKGYAINADATSQVLSRDRILSLDPPYYDNIGYADLSDFFYVWLRRTLKFVFPDLFTTINVTKTSELVATPLRHGSKEKAEAFFLNGMTQAMNRIAILSHPGFPVTIYYAFKQTENDGSNGLTNTGWDTFLEAVLKAGFSISGTWPMRTERSERSVGLGTNALASSIVLVCRPRPSNAPTTTRREFVNALKSELPSALAHLQRGNIAPVDLAQAAIGPGMAVYTRYARVLDAQGQPLTVRDALTLINQILDETLAEQEGDFDADSRWALAWFDQHGFTEGEFGVAETLSKAKNTSVQGMVEAGILESRRGRVRLLKPVELPENWNPQEDPRRTAWEAVHHLIRALESGGESAAAELVAQLGSQSEIARELAYRLYTICERRRRSTEALSYNGLVQSWPEIVRLSSDYRKQTYEQTTMFA